MDKEVRIEDLVFRKAKKTDNMDDIATLIYQTDPYIYPYWFQNDLNKAKEFLGKNIKEPGFVFNYKNLFFAYDTTSKKIVGLIVSLDKNTDFEFDYEKYIRSNKNHKVTINKYVKECIKDVVENDDLYIMNCTVLEECRGKKIGTRLLRTFIKGMEREGYESFRLDCLLHNLRAKNLYHSFGFKEMEEVTGFNGYSDKDVEVVVFKRHKGDYLPEEFQKYEHYEGVRSALADIPDLI